MKPRLKRVRGWWVCSDGTYKGDGPTPEAAYDMWVVFQNYALRHTARCRFPVLADIAAERLKADRVNGQARALARC